MTSQLQGLCRSSGGSSNAGPSHLRYIGVYISSFDIKHSIEGQGKSGDHCFLKMSFQIRLYSVVSLKFQIGSKQKDEGKKKKSLKLPCPFCDQSTVKLTKHILETHKNHPDVIRCSKLPKKDRLEEFAKFRKKGIFEKTIDLFDKGKTEAIFGDKNSAKDTKLCGICKGFYSASTFSRHQKRCCETNSLTYSRERPSLSVARLTSTWEILNDPADKEEFEKDVLSNMFDDISSVYRSDELILTTAITIWKKRGKLDKGLVLADMRVMGNAIFKLLTLEGPHFQNYLEGSEDVIFDP